MTYIFKTFYYTLILAFVAVGGLLLFSLAPVKGNIALKIVESGSMQPAIRVGSVVVVRPHAPYDVGDVITFKNEQPGSMPVTHRIVAKTKEAGLTYFTTRGDANKSLDTYQVPERNVIGKVLVAVPYLGFIIDFARRPLGFLFLIGIPAGFVMLDELYVIWSEVSAWYKRRRTQQLPNKQKKEKQTPTTPTVPRISSVFTTASTASVLSLPKKAVSMDGVMVVTKIKHTALST